jgi:hypothetical protein
MAASSVGKWPRLRVTLRNWQVHHAGLHSGLWPDRADGVVQARQPVAADDEGVLPAGASGCSWPPTPARCGTASPTT